MGKIYFNILGELIYFLNVKLQGSINYKWALMLVGKPTVETDKSI